MLPWVDHRDAQHLCAANAGVLRACACLWLGVLCLTLMALLMPCPTSASGADLDGDVTQVVAPVDPRVPPALAIDASDRLFLAWQELGTQPDRARIVVATRPFTTPVLLGTLGISPADMATSALWQPPVIAPADTPGVAWSDGAGLESAVHARTDQELVAWEPGPAELWTYGFTGGGALSVAWYVPGMLVVEQPAEGSVISIALPAELNVTALHLTYGSGRTGYLAWSATDSSGASAGVWYAYLGGVGTAGTAVLAAPEGLLRAATVDPDDNLHLAWSASGGLWYGRPSRDAALVRSDLRAGGGVALAAGPAGEAHLIWLEGQSLRYARSSDWVRSLATLPASGVLSAALAVDSCNHPRIAWIEQAGGEDARLMLYEPRGPSPMVSISWPTGGELVRAGSRSRVETNLPKDAWVRMAFYVQPVDERGAQAPLYWIGEDKEGADDGWGIALNDIDEEGPVRLVVIAQDRFGRGARAESAPFTFLPEGRAALWHPLEGGADSSGIVTVSMDAQAWPLIPESADVYLAPGDSGVAGAKGDVEMTYLGHLAVERAGAALQLDLDTRRISDGCYVMMVRQADQEGGLLEARSAGTITVDNTRAPRVDAVLWDRTLPAGQVGLVAQMDREHRTPQRVDFYLQATSTEQRGERPIPDAPLTYLGSDDDASDGWSLRAEVNPRWADKAWRAWALACDGRGLCGAGATEPRLLQGHDSPALWLASPGATDVLSGSAQIVLQGDIALYQVARADAFLAHADGSLSALGRLRWNGRAWAANWDTAAFSDGSYQVVAHVALVAGGRLELQSVEFEIANQSGWRLGPLPDSIEGDVRIDLSAERSDRSATVDIHLVDQDGGIHPVGSAAPGSVNWSVLWNTYDVLNGTYTLVASVRGGEGQLARLERRVRVENLPLEIAFLRAPGVRAVSGLTTIVWRTSGDATRTAVRLEYSPDGGQTWIGQAGGLGGNGSMRWDSRAVPDSRQGMLRLIADDGERTATGLAGPFTVDNEPEPPQITVLWPLAGEVLSGQASVGWVVTDPDGDDLEVDLMYRSEPTADWVALESNLPPRGEHTWDASHQSPSDQAALRIVATDSRGATALETVEPLSVVNNLAPQVALLWPREDVALSASTAILWQASDPDGDLLTIDLYYSDDDGVTWMTLARGLENSGYYLWELTFLPPGETYRLRVTASDRYHTVVDQSQGVVTTGEQGLPAVYLVEPWAGSVVHGVAPIRWQTSYAFDAGAKVDLVIRSTGSGEWASLAFGLDGVGSYMWDTSRYPDGSYDLAVRLRRGNERSLSNVIAQVRVLNGSSAQGLLLETPGGGEPLQGLVPVRWSHADADPLARALIEASVDGGSNWLALGSAFVADGEYLWDTASWPAVADCRLRLTIPAAGVTATSASFALGGAGSWPPRVDVGLYASSVEGSGRLSWEVTDADGGPLDLDLSICREGGECLNETRLEGLQGDYDLALPAGVGRLTVRLSASDGFNTVEAVAHWHDPASASPEVGLELLEPVARQVYSGGIPIVWEARGPDGAPVAMDLEYSADGGQNWHAIIVDLENVGRYLWQTSLLANGTYRVRLTAESNGGTTRAESGSFVLNTPGRTYPMVSLAVDGMALSTTGSRAIHWRAEAEERSPKVRLEYALGRDGPWKVLADGLRYQGEGWSAESLPNGPVWVRLVANEGIRVTISPPVGPLNVVRAAAPRVQLVACEGRLDSQRGDGIAWAAMGGSGVVRVDIESSRDAGSTWAALATGLPAVGSLSWEQAGLSEGVAWLRAVARAGDRLGMSDTCYVTVPRETADAGATADVSP